MTLAQAYDLLDILIDKANNPYFTSNEKNNFLELAITEFIKKYYSVNDLTEQSRAALKGITESRHDQSTSATIRIDADLIYLLSVGVQYNLPNRVPQAQGFFDYHLAKQVSPAEFRFQSDPFNKPTKENPIYTYVNSGTALEIHILPDRNINEKYLYFIKRPTLADVFASSDNVIEETYQHEVVQIAARKMVANIESSNYEVQSQESQ